MTGSNCPWPQRQGQKNFSRSAKPPSRFRTGQTSPQPCLFHFLCMVLNMTKGSVFTRGTAGSSRDEASGSPLREGEGRPYLRPRRAPCAAGWGGGGDWGGGRPAAKHSVCIRRGDARVTGPGAHSWARLPGSSYPRPSSVSGMALPQGTFGNVGEGAPGAQGQRQRVGCQHRGGGALHKRPG